MINNLRKIALGTVAIAAVIGLFATGPEVATHQAQACPANADVDCNPPTGNPHPGGVDGDVNPNTGTETGNPHNSAGCSGNPHGEMGTDTCPGSK